jgi:hypothetical protein
MTNPSDEFLRKILEDQEKTFREQIFNHYNGRCNPFTGVPFADISGEDYTTCSWTNGTFHTSAYTQPKENKKNFTVSSLTDLINYFSTNRDKTMWIDKNLFYGWLADTETIPSDSTIAFFAGVPLVIAKTVVIFWCGCAKCGEKHLPFAVDDTVVCFVCGEGQRLEKK